MGTPKPVQPAMAVAAVRAGTVVSVLVEGVLTAFRAKRMPKIMARVLCRFLSRCRCPRGYIPPRPQSRGCWSYPAVLVLAPDCRRRPFSRYRLAAEHLRHILLKVQLVLRPQQPVPAAQQLGYLGELFLLFLAASLSLPESTFSAWKVLLFSLLPSSEHSWSMAFRTLSSTEALMVPGCPPAGRP